MKSLDVIIHSAIRIESNSGLVIYFDPFRLEEVSNDADIIFITHPHYDHFSKDDILKVKENSSKIIVPSELFREAIELGFESDSVLCVEPNSEYSFSGIKFETIPAYNINKDFHKKEYNWVGYVVNVDNTVIYVAGDTDCTSEAKSVSCDIALVPVGGTFTMTSNEAADLIKEIMPRKAIPIHYGSIVGSKADAIDFKEILDGIVDVEIKI